MNISLDKRYFYFIILCFISSCMIVRSLLFIYNNYYIPLYWDEWMIGFFVSRDPSILDYLKEIFNPQNEHVIASTKLLLFADYKFFAMSNLPLILTTAIEMFIIAAALVCFVVDNEFRRQLFIPSWLVFSASGLSLVQWENLLWGFQPQFGLVLIGAFLSIACALNATKAPVKLRGFWLGALWLAMGFCMFSMGNGVAIPIPVLFLLLLYRVSWTERYMTIGVSLVYVGIFLFLTRGSIPIGDPTLKTPHNIVMFFLAMLGGPLSSDTGSATLIGMFLFFGCFSLFVYHTGFALVWSRPIDRRLAGLFALVGFLLASAAAAAWGRTTLGIGVALSSRYATPMLLLWMVFIAITMRTALLMQKAGRETMAVVQSCLALALACVGWSNYRPDLIESINGRKTPIEQAGYFVASHVFAPLQLAELYPVPSLIRQPLLFMREKRLNIFADRLGLAMPKADEIQALSISPQPSACAFAHIDKITQISGHSWQVAGWATDSGMRTPKWIMAEDQSNRLAGFTRPLTSRADVIEIMHAAPDFKGFLLPVYLSDPSQTHVALTVIAQDGYQPCRVEDIGSLPTGPDQVDPQQELKPLSVNIHGGTEGHSGTPTGLVLPSAYVGAKTVGTWVWSDADTHEVTLEVSDPTCQSFVLPVTRGPSANGQRLTIHYANGVDQIVDISAIRPQVWTYFEIKPAVGCRAGKSNTTLMTLKDAGKGWGEWSAVAIPGIPN